MVSRAGIPWGDARSVKKNLIDTCILRVFKKVLIYMRITCEVRVVNNLANCAEKESQWVGGGIEILFKRMILSQFLPF